MDVPFLSSSALNREQYHLVQSVEAASNLRQIDDILAHKVQIIRNRFERRVPSNADCYASLIILLYCFTTTTTGRITRESLEFALPHAVTLAETGSKLKEKRVGYLFCTELMKDTDDLQLMLVNTLRKDLEDRNPARISLALDVLLTNCPPDAMPAIKHRLTDLLAHDSPHVKRKALMLIRSAGKHEPELLMTVQNKLLHCLNDPDASVVSVALLVLEDTTRADILEPRRALQMINTERFFVQTLRNRRLTQRFVQVVGSLTSQLAASDFEDPIMKALMDTILDILSKLGMGQQGAGGISFTFLVVDAIQALILECFKTSISPPSLIGKILSSRKPNTQYLCLECLLHLNPVLWAGIETDVLIAFDELQVHTIMTYLDSPDRTIRVKTLQVLSHVDRSILFMHLTQLLSSPPSVNEISLAEKALEIVSVYEQDGVTYANRLLEICRRLSSHERARGKEKEGTSGAHLVAENIVEQILVHLGTTSDSFRGEFVNGVIAISPAGAGPTFSLIIAAVVCEYGGLSSVPQDSLLQNLGNRLKVNPPAIQEALLLSMLRTLARCEMSVIDVVEQVRDLYQSSGGQIQERCQQYLRFSGNMRLLKAAAERAKSNTLPDFLFSIENSERMPHGNPKPVSSPQKESTRGLSTSSASGKLRYDAYDAPRVGPKLTHRRNSNRSIDSSSSAGSRSTRPESLFSPEGRRLRDIPSRGSEFTDDNDNDHLAHTLTAGGLAVVAYDPLFVRAMSNSIVTERNFRHRSSDQASKVHVEDITSKTDLIALESPFLTEPTEPKLQVVTDAAMNAGFESIWGDLKGKISSRGWSEKSPRDLQKSIQLLDYHIEISAKEGEICVVLGAIEDILDENPSGGIVGAVRILSGEDRSSLWQLRCIDDNINSVLRKVLED